MKKTLLPLLALVGASLLSLEASADDLEPPKVSTQHGFRMGYTYGHKINHQIGPIDIRSPHMSTLGYEVTETVESGVEGFRFIAVQNILLSGLEQGLALPSFTAMVGYEVFGIAQVGVGANFGLSGARLIIAGGFNPAVGDFQLPLHVHFIPDPDGRWRTGISTGVNF
jgi:hypothetical protein